MSAENKLGEIAGQLKMMVSTLENEQELRRVDHDSLLQISGSVKSIREKLDSHITDDKTLDKASELKKWQIIMLIINVVLTTAIGGMFMKIVEVFNSGK